MPAITRADGQQAMQNSDAETRLTLALTRAVLENLRPNRLMIPFFALVMCGMFAQWVGPVRLAIWYALVLAGLMPTLLVTRAFPTGDLAPARVRKWTMLAAAANLAFVISWSSLGWFLWVPGNDFNHLLIQLVLASALAAHGNLVGPSRQISLPAFFAYAVVMALVPLQAHRPTYTWLALVTPFYVGYIAVLARQHHTRTRAALILTEEKNNLIAELARAKKQSDLARDRAEAASTAKSQFLANMSHELRTPLNAIIGFSQLIETRIFKDVEKHYEYAGLINTSGTHLLALINDILDLAKIEAGRWKLTENEIDLGRLAADTLHLVTWKAQENGCLLETDVAPDLPPINADERALKQVWLNLLSNAVKFTPKDGHITAFAGLDAEGAPFFGVADTGIGIAPADQARVFESFGQGQHDIAIAEKGTGLGLAIVKGLAHAHGGTVTLDSKPNQGTRVTVSLPAWRVRARTQRASG